MIALLWIWKTVGCVSFFSVSISHSRFLMSKLAYVCYTLDQGRKYNINPSLALILPPPSPFL